MEKISARNRCVGFALNVLTIGILLASHGSVTHAQTVSASSQTARATGTVGVSLPLVVEDAPFSLADGLVRELRNGGYVLFIRHGALDPATVDRVGPGAW